jgi:tetratricopeptide (TPR) repeat protein
LRLLVLLAEEDSRAVVNACKVAAQGQFWQPNMFVFSLQKRHQDHSTLCELAARLLECFSEEMPIPPPIVLDQYDEDREAFARLAGEASPLRVAIGLSSPSRGSDNGTALPLLTGNYRSQSPHRPLFSPTTTMSKLYQEAPSPYCPTMKLPLARPPTSPVDQSRRAKIFSMPKLAAVEGQRQYRCNTPNAPPSRLERSLDVQATRTLDPLFGSPPQSPSGSSPNKPRVAVSEKYLWNPECINSVSGFEWWWRSLPQNHASLEPTQKLKMVTKAAVRLHSKGELPRAIDLYQLALSSETNDEVKFRLRINLACAFEAAEDLPSSADEFRLALELNPNDPYALYKLGSVLTATGAFEEARALFESIRNEYPPAVEGLKSLERAVQARAQEEEARKDAIAAAKARRSPPKVVSPRVYIITPREPVAPSTPVAQPPAPHRKKAPAAKREQPKTSVAPGDSTSDVPARLESPSKPETATVATLTDDHIAPPSLLELLVRRCQEARINLLEVLRQLDPQQRGLVHRESFMHLLRVLAGVDALEEDARMALCIAPIDWVWRDDQELLAYEGFVKAYTEQHQSEAALLSSGEVVRVRLLVDDLIRRDLANVSHRSVSDWLRVGSERAAAELHRTSSELSSSGDDSAAASAPRKQSTLTRSSGGTHSSPDLHASDGDLSTPRTHVKKDRAREEWLLAAEKTRVLARRQQHCMKSLRDIATRARAHIISRRNAMAFLLVAAQSAQDELAARRLRCATARHEGAEQSHEPLGSTVNPPSEPDATETRHANSVKELSEEAVHASVRAAMARLCASTDLQDLKTVASRFTAFCRVPSFMSATQAPVVDETHSLELAEGAPEDKY